MRRHVSGVGPFLAVAVAWILAARCAEASCDIIPPASPIFRAAIGDLDRPFARPGDWLRITLDSACHGVSPGFSGTAADQIVTLLFEPPSGGPIHVVALATDCGAVDTASCAARPDVESATCLTVNTVGDAVSLERVDQRTLRFRFPDTDAQFSPNGDDATLTGPATVAVTAAGQPLPCHLASETCHGQTGLLACADALFQANGTCNPAVEPAFGHFTALPLPNNYQALCTAPVPPCTGQIDDLRFTIDAAGNALVPMDWRGILVERDAVPIARLLRGATTLEAFEGRGVPLRIPDLETLASYSPAGVRLPPLFDPQRDPTQTSSAAFFGSADAPETVLRIARHRAPSPQCVGGTADALPCTSAAHCPGGGCEPPRCAGGTAAGTACAADGECPGGECGAGLFDFSTRLAGGAGPIVLRLGACVGGSNPLATCTGDLECPGGQCGSFSFEALDPVPLDGLNQSPVLNAFVTSEAIGNPPADLNGDGDAIDAVVRLSDRNTGIGEAIGAGGAPARAIARIRQAPFSFAALALENDLLAFLEPEILQGTADANANGRVFETVLRVFRLGGGEITGAPLAADVAPRIGGRSLAISNSEVFFLTSESSVGQQETVAVSVDSNGNLASGGTRSSAPSLSYAGRYVAFFSDATNLVAGDTNDRSDVFVHDRDTSLTRRVSVRFDGQQSNRDSEHPPVLSADGRHVAFTSHSCNIIPGECDVPNGDTNGLPDVFVHDRDTDADGVFDEPGAISTARVSVSTSGAEGDRKSGSYRISISANGRHVAFPSDAGTLVAGDNNPFSCLPGEDCGDVFVRDRDTDSDGVFDEPGAVATIRVSVSSDGLEGNGVSHEPFLSGDGRFVVFSSAASNLVPGDTNNADDVFLHDRDSDEDGIFDEPGFRSTVRISVDSVGSEGNGPSFDPKIAANGCCVGFTSLASNLVAGDVNGKRDIFVRDLVARETTLVSHTPTGAPSLGNSGGAGLSADGRFVVFNSSGGNDIVAEPLLATANAFLHDRLTGATVLVSRNTAGDATNDETPPPPWISADGRSVAYGSRATNLVAGDGNGAEDIFVRGAGDASGDLTGDGDADDDVLRLLDASAASPTATGLCPATAVAIEGGRAAFLRPENAGQTPALSACPASDVLVDGDPVLNGDSDADDEVVHLWRDGSVENLGVAGSAVVLSSEWVAALVPEAAQGETDLNGDGDVDDAVAQVRPLGGAAWSNVGESAEGIALAGARLALLTSERSEGATDLNGDGDTSDRVVQFHDASLAATSNLARAAEDFVLGPSGLLAFRTREAHQGEQVLNQDGDADDDVLIVYDPETNTLVNSGHAVTPCRLEACDPRLPYRVLEDTVTYLTLEADQGADLNGDGDQDDLVLQVLNVRQAVGSNSLEGAAHTLAAVSAGICTDSGAACAGDESCAGGDCFVPPGGCVRALGSSCNPTVADSCGPQAYCQPVLGSPSTGTCFALEGPCGSNADCTAPAICNESAEDVLRLVNPLAPREGGTAVFPGAGRCVEDFGTACSESSDCGAGRFCEAGTCRRDHGVCAGDAHCPTGSLCVQDLLSATVGDRDLDEVPDAVDNCPDVPNVLQADGDADGDGDACDASLCGNGTRDPGESCDDGNVLAGDACPPTCIEPARLIRGNRSAPLHSRACQAEWYVENPNQPPDRFGLPDFAQDCVDQDPTCDFDPTPGQCGFRVAICLNNEDPHLPACTPSGVAGVVPRPAPSHPNAQVRAILTANAARVDQALTHLLDPADAAAGYSKTVPLEASQRNWCSAPFAVDVPLAGRARARVRLKVKSTDAAQPRPRAHRSQVRLTCTQP